MRLKKTILYEAIDVPIDQPPKMEIYYNERYLTALGAAPRCKNSVQAPLLLDG